MEQLEADYSSNSSSPTHPGSFTINVCSLMMPHSLANGAYESKWKDMWEYMWEYIWEYMWEYIRKTYWIMIHNIELRNYVSELTRGMQSFSSKFFHQIYSAGTNRYMKVKIACSMHIFSVNPEYVIDSWPLGTHWLIDWLSDFNMFCWHLM